MAHDAGELSRMLAGQIDNLVRELLPDGRREGAEWVHPSLSGTSRRSLSVRLTGSKRGVWGDFSSGEVGDALGLIKHVLYRSDGDRRAAMDWARHWLGIASDAPPARRQAPAPAPKAVDDNADLIGRRRAAMAIFLSAQAAIATTPVAAYLAGRGIDLGELGRQPASLRFHPSLSNQESGRAWPAMVAAVVNGAGEMVSVHRTWLYRDRAGSWHKAPLRNPKMSLGQLAGGTVRLWRGASGKPLKQAPAGDVVLLTEGIEDGLSCALLCPELRVLSAVSLTNMTRVELPAAVKEVIIAADKDGDNVAAARSLQAAVDHLLREGRAVRIARSPWGKDFNDLLQADLA